MVSLLSEFLYTNTESVQALQHKLLLLKNNFKNSDKHIREFFQKQNLLNSIFEICEDCKNMAALPQGAFVACKLREQYNDKGLMVSRLKSGGDKNESKFYNGNKKLMDYSPVKYNEKLMNSIWGFYNRYSPHNIKSNEMPSDDSSLKQQQQSAAATHVIAHKIAMAVTTGKEWCFRERN